MTDDARGDMTGEDDRLPWLEAVEEDEEPGGPSVAKLLGAIFIGLIAIGVIVGGLFWIGNRNNGGGDGEVIAAPEGDYKVRPVEPGGMNVAGEGDTAYAASEGAEPRGQLNTNAVPETPVTRPPPAPPQQAQPRTPPTAQPRTPPRAPAPAPAAPAASGGATIQLGAFSSQAGAVRAWAALSGRFHYLAPMTHSIVPVASGGRTLYRLRAGGPDAARICRRLTIAGEACTVVS